MATQPIICPYEEVPGFRFFRGNLVLDDGKTSSPPVYMYLSDIISEVTSFSKSSVTVRPSSCILLSQTDIGDSLGYVSFIAIRANFVGAGYETKKYYNWTYDEVTYTSGELLILSGPSLSATTSIYEGWFLSKPGVYSQSGGILLCNPHTDITIKMEILVAL